MTGRALSDEEKTPYRAGGFRLAGPLQSESNALRDRLALAWHLLTGRGADAGATSVALAVPPAPAPSSWQSGDTPMPVDAMERIEVVLALYRRLVEPGDVVAVKPLPSLWRPGRRSLAARDLVAGGRLCDLLALWRQLCLEEETADRKPTQRRRTR
jgi:hypothetical protein